MVEDGRRICRDAVPAALLRVHRTFPNSIIDEILADRAATGDDWNLDEASVQPGWVLAMCSVTAGDFKGPCESAVFP